MWLSGGRRNRPSREGGADVGMVTLSGDPAGVYLSGERREVPVFGPGGYCWRPMAGEQALVIKTGEEGELPCMAGVRCGDEGRGLQPGEICITAPGGASLQLGTDGTLNLCGNVLVNGKPLVTGGGGGEPAGPGGGTEGGGDSGGGTSGGGGT